jgi:hypothetical protein
MVSIQKGRHNLQMATYEISSEIDRGFNVKIVGDDGARQTMLGFPTREAAEAWIVDDRRRSHAEHQTAFRDIRQ